MSSSSKWSSTSISSSSSSGGDVENELRRGPWTLDEDTLLIHYISQHGEGRWNLLAKRSGLNRTGKSCRLRWLNYLKPDVKRGSLTPQEQISILELHSKWGNRWSKIAQYLPGRTDNEIKNYWRTRVQKQARHLKIDANSDAFQEIIRCFFMPRLLQKMDNNNIAGSSNSNINSQPFDHDDQQGIIDGMNNYGKANGLESSSSDSDHGIGTSTTTSCVSQLSHFKGYQTDNFHANNNNNYSGGSEYSYSNTFAKDFCHFDDHNNCYDIENVSQPEIMPEPVAGDFGNWVHEYDLAGDNNMWNMDELWQFKNSYDDQ